MSTKEQASLAKQLPLCWAAVKRAAAPVSLHLAGLGSCPSSCLTKGGAEIPSWKVHRIDDDVVEAFDPSHIIFLSPDAAEPLPDGPLDPLAIYVIGGLVDTSVRSRVSLGKAATVVGARARRLPIAEHLPSATNPRLALTLTSVLQILLAVNEGYSWCEALQRGVAPRHQRPASFENGRRARRARARKPAETPQAEP
jgi:hypothetical protein